MSVLQAAVSEASVEFFHRDFARPLQLSSGSITKITEARVSVAVDMPDGRRGIGRGSVYLSHQWAWRGGDLSPSQRDDSLRALCLRIASSLPNLCGRKARHPLDHGLILHEVVRGWTLDDNPPSLARAVCASPFDAALHDAVGLALGQSAFHLYDDDIALPVADRWFPTLGASAAIRKTLRAPMRALNAWLVVCRDDSLDEMMGSLAFSRGIRAFKLKTRGDDPRADARWTGEVYRAAREYGIARPRLCVDSNEGNPTVASVVDYLAELRRRARPAYDALEYLEQPTRRDIPLREQDWQPATRMKPIFIDEALSDAGDFSAARKSGWSGFAIKTCKGHSFCLIAAAWARLNELQLVMQDLTNSGFAAIHSALFASHIHPRNGIELNSPQYTPEANAEWLPRLQSLLEPTDGLHRLPHSAPAGLGSGL